MSRWWRWRDSTAGRTLRASKQIGGTLFLAASPVNPSATALDDPTPTPQAHVAPAPEKAVKDHQRPPGHVVVPAPSGRATPADPAPRQVPFAEAAPTIAAKIAGAKESGEKDPLKDAKDLDSAQEANRTTRRSGADERSGGDRRDGSSTPERGRRFTDGRRFKPQPDRGGERSGHEPRGTRGDGASDVVREPRIPRGSSAPRQEWSGAERRAAQEPRSGTDRRDGSAPPEPGRRFADRERRFSDRGRHFAEVDRGGERRGQDARGSGTGPAPRSPREPRLGETPTPAGGSSGRRFRPEPSERTSPEKATPQQQPRGDAAPQTRRSFKPKPSGPDRGPSQ